MVEEQMKKYIIKIWVTVNNNNNMNLNNQKYNNIGTGGIGAKPRIIDVDSQKVGNTIIKILFFGYFFLIF